MLTRRSINSRSGSHRVDFNHWLRRHCRKQSRLPCRLHSPPLVLSRSHGRSGLYDIQATYIQPRGKDQLSMVARSRNHRSFAYPRCCKPPTSFSIVLSDPCSCDAADTFRHTSKRPSAHYATRAQTSPDVNQSTCTSNVVPSRSGTSPSSPWSQYISSSSLPLYYVQNHITYRFGKGLTPKQYRLDLGSMAVIMDEYASSVYLLSIPPPPLCGSSDLSR